MNLLQLQLVHSLMGIPFRPFLHANTDLQLEVQLKSIAFQHHAHAKQKDNSLLHKLHSLPITLPVNITK